MPRSGVDGPRFANIEWIPVKIKPRGSQPITQQRQEKAGVTSRSCPSLCLSKAWPQKEPPQGSRQKLKSRVVYLIKFILLDTAAVHPKRLSHKSRAQTSKCIWTMPPILIPSNIHALLTSMLVGSRYITLRRGSVCCSRLERIPTPRRQL